MTTRQCSYRGCSKPMSVDYLGVPEGQMVLCAEHSEIFLDACLVGMPAQPEAIAAFLRSAGIERPQ